MELHAECCEVRFAAVPGCVEFLFEDFASLDHKRAPACVDMVQDLDWGGVAIGGVDVLELQVALLVKSATHVRGDAT